MLKLRDDALNHKLDVKGLAAVTTPCAATLLAIVENCIAA
jgi:hypothetical protein